LGLRSWGICVNLRKVIKEHRKVKVSHPFEGGVAGRIDYMTFTRLYFPAGVVDLQNTFKRKSLKTLCSSKIQAGNMIE